MLKLTEAIAVFAVLIGVEFAIAGPPKLGANDVTWLWPVPASLSELSSVIAIESLNADDGTPVWSDKQFADLMTAADGDASSVGKFRIRLPASVKNKKAWRIVAFRADPTAPGGHELIRQNLGEKPQLRLILQPVTTENDQVNVHDIAVHLVYDFVVRDGEAGKLQPDRNRFRDIVAGLDELKQFAEDAGLSTSGKPLGIHPALKARTAGLDAKVREFLSRHLHATRVSAMALMGLDGPEPWIFIPLSRSPTGDGSFAPIPILPAQMLSFRSGGGVVAPAPKVNNLGVAPTQFPMPVNIQDRRGVSTSAMFDDAEFVPEDFAIIGVDANGEQVRDEAIRNRDIPDVIADPLRSHFFNTDCISCHTETRRRLRFSLAPGAFAFRQDGEPPAIEPEALPKDDWNVRNLGWFPRSDFIGGGQTLPTVTQRTANETAEVVEFIERHYRHSEGTSTTNGEAVAEVVDSAHAEGKKIKFLDQGWTAEEREEFYYLGQGSQLIPYSWFVCLELPNSETLLRSDEHLRSRGFIIEGHRESRNPDGLPIGLVKDSNPVAISARAAFLGTGFQQELLSNTGDWIGLTCAACHTSQIEFQGQSIRIDGGAAMVDMESFLQDVAASMRAAVADPEKFKRFEQRVREQADGDIDTTGLAAELTAFTPVIEELVARNKAKHPYGYGRLDAFGAILNQICEAGLGVPENRRESNAPVSFPFLWDASQLDWVQWNSSVDAPISRNVGEVLGVFAQFQLTGDADDGQFNTSARLDYLHRLETQLSRLRAPAWPSEALGEIDPLKAAAGKQLFENNCAKCHNMRDDAGNFRMTKPNEFGRTFIKTTSVPFQLIGTDPQMARNFITRTAKPGALEAVMAPVFDDPATLKRLEQLTLLFKSLGIPETDFRATPPAAMLLGAAVSGVIKRDLRERFQHLGEEEIQQISLELRGFRTSSSPPNGGAGYKARPLNGIWATAPYGHAGAVPNLYQWLLPETERVKNFSVGSLEFDPKHVGFASAPTDGAFAFSTTAENGEAIAGNSNLGHSGPNHTDFTDEERWQLIEYLKSCR